MRDRRVLLGGIVLIALVVRLAGMGDRLSEDEGFSWLVASAPDAGTFLERLAAYENTPPLHYLLLAPLPLDDEHWLRLPSLLASVASVGVLYLAVRPLLGTRAALLSALALAVAPYAISWSNFSRGFMLANLGVAIALWGVARLATGGTRRWWWVYAGGAVLAIYSEYNAFLFLAALVAAFALVAPERRREILLFGALPALAMLPWTWEFLRSLDALNESKATPKYPNPSPASARDAVVPLFFGEHGSLDTQGGRTVQLWLLTAALAGSVALLARAGKAQAARLLGYTALAALALHAVATLFGPGIFHQRYLTSLIPLGAALIAGGAACAPWRRAVPALAAVLLAASVVVFAERHGRELEPDMAPVRALIERSGERVVLTNSARVMYYLDDLEPRLDRPLGFGAGAEAACGAECGVPLAVVDDFRPPGGLRTGPGEKHRFGPVEVRLRPKVSGSGAVGMDREEMDPLTCNLALLVTAALGGAPDARALPVTFQDDALLLHRTSSQVQATARRMASLGGDRVRLTAGWSALAPRPGSRRMPKFDARDSNAYPRDPWARLDRAVKAVSTAGMEVQIDVAFFAPRWAVKRAVKTRHVARHRWEPDPRRFGDFATAVASRYDGRHPDPARPGQTLPRVRLWTAWNEPNHAAFLLPQWRMRNGRWVPRSPHVYRELHERGYNAIKGVSAANKVLLGGLSSEGMDKPGPRRGIPPLHFLRELACVDRRGRKLDERPECAGFKPLRADGFAHHPYSLYDAPNVPSRDPDEVAMGDLQRLSDTLERLQRRGRIAQPLPIHLTEYGYETNPPDIDRGVSLEDQARYHGLATFMAWQRADVHSFAQFLLNDIAPPPGARAGSFDPSADWHSGLYFHDGRAKPAVQAFKLPFWAEARSVAGQDVVVLFGQVRPSEGRQRASIELQGADGIWRPIRSLETRATGDGPCGRDTADFLTDPEGFYLRVAPYQGPATYRVRWLRNGGAPETGVPITVGAPTPLT